MIVVGLVLILVSFVLGLVPALRGSVSSLGARLRAILMFLVGVALMVSSGFTQIGVGQVGVASLFGSVDQTALEPGLHLINPLKSVVQLSTRTETFSAHAGEDQTAGNSIDAVSADGMRMPLDTTVLYRLVQSDAPWVYEHLGEDYGEKVIVPAVRTAVREALSRFTAQEAYGPKRDELTAMMNDNMRKHVRALLDDYQFKGQAVVIQQVLLRNIGIPEQVRDAIEKKLSAEQQSLAMRFVLEKETQEAERKRIEGRGIADFQKIVTEGISDKLLAWKGIEATLEVSKSHNAKVVIIGNGKNGLPIIFDSPSPAAKPNE
jgi:regulator of protease activity HflC (stomatin/prohibitin superfamily)